MTKRIEVLVGIFKVIEEMGELAQALCKMTYKPYGAPQKGGPSYRQALLEEIADVEAAIDYFKERTFTQSELASIATRRELKLKKFTSMGLPGIPLQEHMK